MEKDNRTVVTCSHRATLAARDRYGGTPVRSVVLAIFSLVLAVPNASADVFYSCEKRGMKGTYVNEPEVAKYREEGWSCAAVRIERPSPAASSRGTGSAVGRPSPAASSSKTSSTETNAESSRKMGRSAVELARTGSLAEAIDLFQKAYALEPEPMLLYNIGRVAERMGDLPKAREALERFAKEEKDPEMLAKGRQALKDVLARRPGSLRITTPVQGALVEVDGKPIGRTPLAKAIEVPPGPHQVKVMAQGKRPFERLVEVVPSESTELLVSMKDELAVAPSPVLPAPVVAMDPQPTPAPSNTAPNDLSGSLNVEAQAKESGGLSTLSWVLIGTGTAAVVAGGIVAGVLLANRGDGAPQQFSVFRMTKPLEVRR